MKIINSYQCKAAGIKLAGTYGYKGVFSVFRLPVQPSNW